MGWGVAWALVSILFYFVWHFLWKALQRSEQQSTQRPGTLKFSKSKQTQQVQKRKLFSFHKKTADKVKEHVEKGIDQRRKAAAIETTVPAAEFATSATNDSAFDLLTQQTGEKEESFAIEDILFSEGPDEPDPSVWKSLGAVELNEEKVISVGLYTIYEISP